MLKINEEILNHGLNMALEFGPNLNQPIHQRLKQKFPDLNDHKLAEINQLCYDVRDEGVNFILSTLGAVAGKRGTIKHAELELMLKEKLAKYLWINEKNLSHIYSQGCYYAWKDGSIDALTP
jgi:hypothetical protein